MYVLTDDDLCLDAGDAVVADAMSRIADDSDARHAFVRAFPALAQEVAGSSRRAGRSPPAQRGLATWRTDGSQ
jgi:hypothetical protein